MKKVIVTQRAKISAVKMDSQIPLRPRNSGSRKSAEDFLASAGLREEDLRVAARVNDQESIKNLVAGGLGISILSERAARNFVDEKRVLAFLLPEDTAQRYLYIVYRKKYILRPYIQAFVDQLKRRYAVALNG